MYRPLEPHPKPLAALIVYERPCDRSRLLRDIASLGIFVNEWPREMPIEQLTYDLAIVCVQTIRSNARLFEEVSKGGSIPTIAVLPSAMKQTDGKELHSAYITSTAYDGGRSLQAAIRSTMSQTETRLTVSPIVQGTRSPNGEWINSRLSPAERRILELLVEANGQPVPQEALASTSTSKSSLSEAYLKTLIFRLRRKLASSLGDNAPTIAAVRGYGYVLRKAVYAAAATPETSAR